MIDLFVGNGATKQITPNFKLMRDKKTYTAIFNYNGKRYTKQIRSSTLEKLKEFKELSEKEFEEKVAEIIFKLNKPKVSKPNNKSNNIIDALKRSIKQFLENKEIKVDKILSINASDDIIEIICSKEDILEISITIESKKLVL